MNERISKKARIDGLRDRGLLLEYATLGWDVVVGGVSLAFVAARLV